MTWTLGLVIISLIRWYGLSELRIKSTSYKDLFLLLKIHQRMSKVITLRLLAMLRPSAIEIPVTSALNRSFPAWLTTALDEYRQSVR